ncbi:MFS transporter [Pseudomonas aeruginosa]|uniref:MFS transporter n=1 Tax=Pseudomonas aeruginosa TaxID=287 RepID=UPI00071BA4E3|nr:MFS transporter [Pseudomonas aeruginosa]KSS83079.1 MFS transporter [Pseudomonas aeruginosa]
MDSPSTLARPHPQASPRWLAVANVIFAGIAAALHVGKATIALPSLQRSFGGDLAALSWIMSAFPFVGVFGGIAAGLLVRRWGDRRLLTGGLAILGGASLLGASMQDFAWLLATRFVEGLGFLIVVVAAPFGLWSTFMAGGIALSMLFGPLLADWRADWQLSALLVLVAALLLPLSVPADDGCRAAGVRPAGLGTLLKVPAITLLALGFTTYNLQFFALMTFLPVFLMQRLGVALETAGLIGAAIVAANALGNVAAGFILSRGIRPGALLASTAILMGLTGAAFFHAAMPGLLAIALGFVFSAVAGMLPTTVLATAPLASPAPSLTPLAIGWVMQGNYLGQVIGPLLIGLIVSRFDWSGAIGLMLVAGAAGAVLGFCLLRALDGLPRAIATGSAARPAD